MQDILTTTPGISTRFAGDLGGGTSGGGAYANYGITGQTTMLMDGVNTRQDATIDQGTGNGPDVGTLEEMQVVTVGGSAEQALPGVFLNMIVKSGGNTFHGRYEAQGISDKFQDDNITPELRAQGITVGDAFKWSGEVSGDLGGPIIKRPPLVLRRRPLSQDRADGARLRRRSPGPTASGRPPTTSRRCERATTTTGRSRDVSAGGQVQADRVRRPARRALRSRIPAR